MVPGAGAVLCVLVGSDLPGSGCCCFWGGSCIPLCFGAAAGMSLCFCTPSFHSVSLKRGGGILDWLVEVWKGSFLADTPERAVEPGVVCGASQCSQVPLERQPGVKWEEDSAMLLCPGVQRESNDLPFLYT